MLSRCISQSPKITLNDIASLTGQDAKAMGHIIVADLDLQEGQVLLKMKQLRKILTQHGVNWAYTSLGGYAACDIKRAPIARGDKKIKIQRTTTQNKNKKHTHQSIASYHLLRDMIKGKMIKRSGFQKSELIFEFNAKDRGLLESSVGTDHFDLEISSVKKLGIFRIGITRVRNAKAIKRKTIRLALKRKVYVLLAKKSVVKGQVLSSSNVTMDEVLIEKDNEDYFESFQDVQGKIAKTKISKGKRITTRHITEATLIKRGDEVSVVCKTGQIQLMIKAIAQSDGKKGQYIMLLNKRSKQKFKAQVVGRLAVVMDLNHPQKGNQ